MHYESKYKNLSFHRENGILEITLHTNGQSLIFNGHTHEELVEAFYDVGNDRDNRVVILTGAGDAFCKEITAEGFDFFTPEGYDKIFKEGRRILEHMLNIEVPMIAAINGPFLVHTEYALVCDMILASEDAEFQDLPHLNFGIVAWRRRPGLVARGDRLDSRSIFSHDAAEALGPSGARVWGGQRGASAASADAARARAGQRAAEVQRLDPALHAARTYSAP